MNDTKGRIVRFTFAAPRTGARKIILRSTMLTGFVCVMGLSPISVLRASAASTQFGNVTVTLQSTLGYNFDWRTAPFNNETATLNNDDGDRNFRSGVFQNRFSALEQLNIQDGNYGFRGSSQAFLDLPYLQNNKNNSPGSFNTYNIGNQSFSGGTVANEGRKLNVLAAFIYGSEVFNDGNDRLSWQLGRQTITWGESLFTLSGISGLQAPIDVYQGESVANPLAQQLFLPTGAASVGFQFENGVTVDAYWQFEYEADILAGVGSYFSVSDITGPGAERLLASAVDSSGNATSIYRAPDIRPANGLDQFGFAAHKTFGNFGLGAYFVRGIPKSPTVYFNSPAFFTPGPAGLSVGQYNVVYAQPVNAYALSMSTLIGPANVAGELSVRTNQPLISGATYTIAQPVSYNTPLYAVGDVVNASLSALYVVPAEPILTGGASIATEVTVNNVVSVTARQPVLVPGLTNIGGDYNLTFTPTYFPRGDTEIEIPIGWSTTFLGDSRYEGTAAGTGIIDVGVKAVYKSDLTIGANYQRYYGSPARQLNLDRDYATIYITKTF